MSVVLFVLALSVDATAQKKQVLNLPGYDLAPYHFGFILGINNMLFTVKPIDNLATTKWDPSQTIDEFPTYDSLFVYSITSSSVPGFTVGILGNLRLGTYFDFRFIPALSFGQRKLNYITMTYRDGDSLRIDKTVSITSTMVELPVEFKYKSKRLNNFRAYVLAGAAYTIDLASQKKTQQEGKTTVKINRNDLMLSAGVGVEFYTQYFKFGTQAKMSYGLQDMIKYENNFLSNSIESLHSKVFLLSFTFE